MLRFLYDIDEWMLRYCHWVLHLHNISLRTAREYWSRSISLIPWLLSSIYHIHYWRIIHATKRAWKISFMIFSFFLTWLFSSIYQIHYWIKFIPGEKTAFTWCWLGWNLCRRFATSCWTIGKFRFIWRKILPEISCFGGTRTLDEISFVRG